MKTIIYLLIWLNCTCPSPWVINTLTSDTTIGSQSLHTQSDPSPRCEPRVQFVDSLDPILEQMAREQKDYGIVQPRTVPDHIYKLAMNGGKVIESTSIEIEPVIEKSTEWIEQERKTIKGFKVK